MAKITEDLIQEWINENHPDVDLDELDEADYDGYREEAIDSISYSDDPYAYNGLSRSDFI